MSATTYFTQITDNDFITIDEVDGGENACHALTYTGDTLKARLFVSEALSLIQSFPDQDYVGGDLVEQLKVMPSEALIGVSIDY